MKKTSNYSVALVTVPSVKIGRAIAQAALKARLAACVNITPIVESHYWWQGKIEKSQEALLMFKTVQSQLAGLEKLVVKKHPYDTPEFLVLPVTGGSKKYLAWLKSGVKK